ncbi:hypothetical protein SAMD00019534_003090 [Acytostelium subglobosum LB1]|uniref:hypothetical protein n=1 Tax=Acytostelium subglobosum LB1 TaxID=1410327 RepID=UPI000644D670|nr:hypothetical protein SAMD00019534_003090 [Acytostelium subglobosum LB1]GAM17134.1 hypothetical protein SAMD00019534_003090 [Acytostelium subglobosum LB1]|eukprot:XP_012759196.1 hypothetical protein SAMD00019534_003090 [Acytostelium subglobosum LB1]
MSLITHKRIFYVNSLNRSSGTISHFTTSLETYEYDEFDRVAVLQACIPKSFYTVPRNRNTFTLIEYDVSALITVPVGNYSRLSLQDTITSLLNAASPGKYTYSITWPTSKQPNTGKYTFLCEDLFHHLGFEQDSTNYFVDGALVSTNVIDLQIENILYIHSDLCSNGSDDVLQELVSKTKKTFYIYLTDKDGVEIFLNGVDMNLTIILFRHNDIYDLTRQYINYLLVKDHESIEVDRNI